MTQTEDVIATVVGIQADSDLARLVAGRADIMTLTQLTHDAALIPQDPGGLSYAERAAFACRIAKLNKDEAFAAHFTALLHKAGASETTARIADQRFDGGGDPRLEALIRHADLVAESPKTATRCDVEQLQGAAIADADIVRLSELVAFVSYQIRVAAGLRLLGGMA